MQLAGTLQLQSRISYLVPPLVDTGNLLMIFGQNRKTGLAHLIVVIVLLYHGSGVNVAPAESWSFRREKEYEYFSTR